MSYFHDLPVAGQEHLCAYLKRIKPLFYLLLGGTRHFIIFFLITCAN